MTPGVVQVAWSMYLARLSSHPVRTKAVTAAAIQGASDVLAQRLSGCKRIDARRTALFALFGSPMGTQEGVAVPPPLRCPLRLGHYWGPLSCHPHA